MTTERQNEIWAFLTLEEKAMYSKDYQSPTEDDWDGGYEAALKDIFGQHNLTAQAEGKPKGPRFKVGDWVVHNHKNRERGQIVAYFPNEKLCYSVRFGNEYHNMAESQLEPDSTIQVGNNNTPNVTKEVDYAQYRLDLAKEIAVAMFEKNWPLSNIALYAVGVANKIVKRLKETEI